MCVKVGEDGKSLSKKDSNILTNCCKTCMSSKLIGSESDFFSNLVIDAVLRVKRINPITKKPSYPIGAINKVLAHGQSSLESKIIDGMVLRQVRASQLMPTRIENAVIACIDFNLNKFRCKMGVQVTVDDPSALAKIRAK
jgi:T-complex protein 1 subunit alpha